VLGQSSNLSFQIGYFAVDGLKTQGEDKILLH
jgi:hypothetical protein